MTASNHRGLDQRDVGSNCAARQLHYRHPTASVTPAVVVGDTPHLGAPSELAELRDLELLKSQDDVGISISETEPPRRGGSCTSRASASGVLRCDAIKLRDPNAVAQLENVYVDLAHSQIFVDGANGMWLGQAPGRNFFKSIWPDADDSTASYRPVLGSDSLGRYATYPGFTNSQGRQGAPPGGGFVSSGSVGVGYLSPGYQS